MYLSSLGCGGCSGALGPAGPGSRHLQAQIRTPQGYAADGLIVQEVLSNLHIYIYTIKTVYIRSTIHICIIIALGP